MKKTLAYKSISEIIATIVIMVLLIALAFSILIHYAFIWTNIAQAFQVILIVVLIILFISVIQLIILIGNPKVMLEYDEEMLYYYYRRKKKVIQISFKDIQNLYAKTSIWTKPFVVYTAIVIMTEKKVFYLRHLEKMNEAKDVIQHIAYHEN